MTPGVLRAIAIGVLLISVAMTILRLTGITTWDLGVVRPGILILAIILLLLARRKEPKG